MGEIMDRMAPARRVSISENLFNKLILQPDNIARTKPDKDFGNPTPIALVGFLISLSSQSCQMMGWQGATGNGAAGVTVYLFFGGLLQFVGGLLEWSLGHTFPSVVFCSFGAFYLSVATNFVPTFNSWGAYAAEGQPLSTGLAAPGYNASAGFFPLWMAMLCFVYMFVALRTNVCFVVVFFLLVIGLCCDASAHFVLASDHVRNAAAANKMAVTSGAVFFVAALIGWYVFVSVMLVGIDFPIQIPIGDLSHVIRGRSERRRIVRGPYAGRDIGGRDAKALDTGVTAV